MWNCRGPSYPRRSSRRALSVTRSPRRRQRRGAGITSGPGSGAMHYAAAVCYRCVFHCRLKRRAMKTTVHALASLGPKQPLKPFFYGLGPLESGQVDIAVESCGICHSDLSMIDNAWGMTTYPLVPGHEVVGTAASRHTSVLTGRGSAHCPTNSMPARRGRSSVAGSPCSTRSCSVASAQGSRCRHRHRWTRSSGGQVSPCVGLRGHRLHHEPIETGRGSCDRSLSRAGYTE